MSPTGTLKAKVQRFWDTLPCGVKNTTASPGTLRFFEEVELQRYASEPHLPLVAEFATHAGEDVLEVGCGLGTDGRQFSKHQAVYIGCDLSYRSVTLARQGFELFDLSGRFANVDAESLPFPRDRFDLVYSNGVLHHSPDTGRGVQELYRVLRPGGKAIVMLYARSMTFVFGVHVLGRLRLARLRRTMDPVAFNRMVGLPCDFRGRLPESVLINQGTDGVGNPHSKLYTARGVRELFQRFQTVRIEKHGFPIAKIPVIGRRCPQRLTYFLGRALGCAWIVKAVK